MKALVSFAALAVTALALQGLPAKAQTTTSGSSSTSSSGSTSSSSSGSASGASTTSGSSGNQQRQSTRQNATTNNNTTVPITFNGSGAGNGTNGANAVDPAGANGANGSNGGGGNNPPFYGQSDITVRTTPTVYAPPVSGGNPCKLAVSGGVSVIGWGAAAGGTFVDQDCADRQKIAMIHNAGYAQAARELMCNDKATYMAFRGTATPCNPRPQWDGTQPGQPIVQPQPTPLAPPPQQQQVIVKDRSNLPRCSRTITDNCFAG